jgi:3-oxoisoapionate-4-phosphate transcarboxylase/hydrolase
MSARTVVTYAVRAASPLSDVVEALARAIDPDGAEVLEVTASGPAEAVVVVALADDTVGANLVALAGALLERPFDLPGIAGLRLLSIDPGAALAATVPGPTVGIPGTRELIGVYERPLLGSIIKPSVGLTVRETAERVRALGEAGLDFLKDDELLADQAHAPLAQRAEAIAAACDDVRAATGRAPMFALNVSDDDVDDLLASCDAVLQYGGRCVMVSLNQVGLGGVLALRRHTSLPIHGHRNGWGFLARSEHWGLAYDAYQALWRMAGIDHLHVNGFANKFWEPDASVAASMRACVRELGGIDPAMPVVSSGQWGGQATIQYETVPTIDFMYLAGGGIQGHPDGLGAGVQAIRAAWEAAIAGTSLDDKAREVPELARAIERFGRRRAA